MASVKDSRTQPSLYTRFSIGSTWELTLVNDEKVVGDVYCTDPLSDVVVLQDQLNDIRIVSVGSIKDSSQLKESTAKQPVGVNMTHTKKVLEEREKRAIRIAQESLRHLNPKVSLTFKVSWDSRFKLLIVIFWGSLTVQYFSGKKPQKILGVSKGSNRLRQASQGMQRSNLEGRIDNCHEPNSCGSSLFTERL